MKKIFLLIIILLTITGCAKYNDLNELAIIKSIGISHDKEYTLFAHVIEEIDKDNNPKMQLVKVNGKSISKLFSNIKLLVNKEIYLAHVDLLILDFNLDNNDYKELIHYFLKSKELRNDFLCIASDDIEKVLENSQYDEIEELIETNKESKNIINITFEEIIKDFLDNQKFNISRVNYNEKIYFDGNYQFTNNKLERIKDEKVKN